MVNSGRYRLGSQHHPASPAIRLIVDLAIVAQAVVAQVMQHDPSRLPAQRAPDHARFQPALEHRGKQGDDMEFHGATLAASLRLGGLRLNRTNLLQTGDNQSRRPASGWMMARWWSGCSATTTSSTTGIRISPRSPRTTQTSWAPLEKTSAIRPSGSPATVSTSKPIIAK